MAATASPNPHSWHGPPEFDTKRCKRQLGVSYPTAWLLRHKIMEVMPAREQRRRLAARVESDDAYLGGEARGGKAGCGSPNKGRFLAAVQTTASGQPVLMCLSQRPFTKESIQAFAEKSLAAPATLVSDGLDCFTALRGAGILKCRMSPVAARPVPSTPLSWP
ncbi:MAG: hypothetical protein C0505_19715 [Leptothrix sp. (in: Bacteria)]|nr:hypothetical protein [Leptothrix sp. (in: b-proteobacteria)]